GQGALAVECRADDPSTQELLETIDDPEAHSALDAERAFLAHLGGGCTLPCGALAEWRAGELHMTGLVASPDGRVVVRAARPGRDAATLGRDVASDVLARGGAALLELDDGLAP